MIIFLLVVAMTVIFVYSLNLFIDWCEFGWQYSAAKLNYKTFKSLYFVNKNKWVCYKNCLLYNSNGERIKVNLTFPAYCWYYYYRKYQAKANIKREENKFTIALLEDCQKDIERMKSAAERQIKKGMEEINELSRLCN